MSTIFRVKKTANFTVMANIHLKDTRLSYKAKGILSEILSLPPDWNYTLSGLATRSAEGVDSVRSGIKELEKCGYVTRRQTRDENGRMSVNEYIVYENPAENPDAPELPENLQSKKATSHGYMPRSLKTISLQPEKGQDTLSASPLSDKPSEEKPLSENPTAVSLSKKLNTMRLSKHQSIPQSRLREKKTDGLSESAATTLSAVRSDIRRKISYEQLKSDLETARGIEKLRLEYADMEQIDELVDIMAELICSDYSSRRIDGMQVQKADIVERIKKIGCDDVKSVLKNLSQVYEPPKNPHAYLQTMLYNATKSRRNCEYFWGCR